MLLGLWSAIGGAASVSTAPAPPPPPPAPPPPPPAPYDVVARLAAFNARLIAVRVAAGASAVSSFSGLQLPEAPTITPGAGGFVSSPSQLTEALATPNAEFTLSGTVTAELYLNAQSHQRWIFPEGSSLIAPSESFAIRWTTAHHIDLVGTGGTVVGGVQGFASVGGGHDIKFRRMDIRTRTNSTFTAFDSIAFERNDKVLFDGCYLFARRGPAHHYTNTNVVFANSEVYSLPEDDGTTESTFRFGESDFVIVMDCKGYNGVKHNFRGHTGNNRLAYWNNQFEGGGGTFALPGGGVDLQNQDLVLIDNTIYHTDTDLCSVPYQARTSLGVAHATRNAMATIVNNAAFSDLDTASGQITFHGTDPASYSYGPGPGWIVSNNPRLPYQAPPAWSRQA